MKARIAVVFVVFVYCWFVYSAVEQTVEATSRKVANASTLK